MEEMDGEYALRILWTAFEFATSPPEASCGRLVKADPAPEHFRCKGYKSLVPCRPRVMLLSANIMSSWSLEELIKLKAQFLLTCSH
jgi:hypothetical protein